MNDRPEVFVMPCHIFLALDANGIPCRSMVGMRISQDHVVETGASYLIDNQVDDLTLSEAADGIKAIIQEMAILACLPVVRALALLNCKNVEAETQHFVRDAKQRKKAKTPLARAVYHTLKLHLPGRVGHSVGAGTHSEAERAFHLVRGHFADYREGAGLFGRLKGVYWIPAHARGSKDAGIITKRYEIKKRSA
jgi:hypothetical protein